MPAKRGARPRLNGGCGVGNTAVVLAVVSFAEPLGVSDPDQAIPQLIVDLILRHIPVIPAGLHVAVRRKLAAPRVVQVNVGRPLLETTPAR